ncbi:hypothetical protein GBA52_010806 [Prunus armeniaca]|nr:hypothetical protein GBA52_010806 [Prunus armeniaca]
MEPGFCFYFISPPCLSICKKICSFNQGKSLNYPDSSFSALPMANCVDHVIPRLDPTEVYNEVIAIPDLSPDEQLKACSWFIENEKQFLMLKTIPIEKKKGMVLMFISPRA